MTTSGVLVRWVFYDPADGAYTFAINPNEGGMPKYKKTITEVATTAAEGHALLFEGADAPPEVSFAGLTHDQADLDVLISWFHKHRQIRVTDDLGRRFWIFITGLDITRKRSRNYPAKATYRITAMVLDSDPASSVPLPSGHLLLESGGSLLLEEGGSLLLESA